MRNTSGIPEYLAGNRATWQEAAAEYVEPAKRNWAGEPNWGIWGLPERDLKLLPDDLTGQRCIELGCGAGYVSAWLARRGGEPIGLDPTPNQLATARQMQEILEGRTPADVDPDQEAEQPAEERLLRPYPGMHRTEWRDSPGQTEFHLPHGKWIELLRDNDFEVERLLELGAPPGATSRYPWADAQWAQSWPTEEAWIARLRQ